MKKKVIVYGASGHALGVADAIRREGRYEIAGFIDDLHPERHGTEFCGAVILGQSEQFARARADGVDKAIIAVGDCRARLKLSESMCKEGFNLVAVIHPQAIVSEDALIGAGTVIAAGAVVGPKVSIGQSVIINTSASVDHECQIEDGVHIGPGARVAGRVVVGRGAWIGIGATIIDNMRVGAGVIVGAGSVVVKDIPDGVLTYGVPARVIKPVAQNEK